MNLVCYWVELPYFFLNMSNCKVDESAPKISPLKIACKKPRKIFKLRFLTETNLHNVRREQIYFYILSLHKKLRALIRKCKRYREKIQQLVSWMRGYCDILISWVIQSNIFFSKMICVCLQDKASRITSPEKKSSPDTNKTDALDTKDSEKGPTSFIDDIKNAAHQAQNEMGFIYEPTSGLYYDARTGYYYNAVCSNVLKATNFGWTIFVIL